MAVMNPQFMSFCFPGGGAAAEYSPDPGGLDGVLHAELEQQQQNHHHQHHHHHHQDLHQHHDHHQHHHQQQQHQPYQEEDEEGGGGYRETTRDLLSFIDSASSNIKLALDKPVKSKRKVNHRKYLQKQIKRCTGVLSPAANADPQPGKTPLMTCSPPTPPLAPAAGGLQGSPPPPPPCPVQGKALPKRGGVDNGSGGGGGVQASLQSKSLAALFNPGQDARGEGGKANRKPPLRHRNLPPSFFTEPAGRHGHGGGAGGPACSTSGVTLGELERGDPDAAEFFELLGPDYSNMAAVAAAAAVASEHGELFQNLPPPAEMALSSEAGAPFDAHHGLGGLLYPETWGGCTAGEFRKGGGGGGGGGHGGGGGGGGQLPLYSLGDGVCGDVEEGSLCSLAFPNFFSDSAGATLSYDLGGGGGYGRAHFSSL
ncbi:unnamed protein product [Boreogadus saida]